MNNNSYVQIETLLINAKAWCSELCLERGNWLNMCFFP